MRALYRQAAAQSLQPDVAVMSLEGWIFYIISLAVLNNFRGYCGPTGTR
jgi:hypothetical protein